MMKSDVEAYLHKHIPITQAMGVSVDGATSDKVVLSAPIANNINHKETVFGGSLQAVATLACWSLLFVRLKNIGVKAQIVIAGNEVAYHKPVDADFNVECLAPEALAWERFTKMLKSKGKARIKLSASLHHRGRLAMSFQGTFVALVNGDQNKM